MLLSLIPQKSHYFKGFFFREMTYEEKKSYGSSRGEDIVWVFATLYITSKCCELSWRHDSVIGDMERTSHVTNEGSNFECILDTVRIWKREKGLGCRENKSGQFMEQREQIRSLANGARGLGDMTPLLVTWLFFHL